jgi:hypothetical protein
VSQVMAVYVHDVNSDVEEDAVDSVVIQASRKPFRLKLPGVKLVHSRPSGGNRRWQMPPCLDCRRGSARLTAHASGEASPHSRYRGVTYMSPGRWLSEIVHHGMYWRYGRGRRRGVVFQESHHEGWIVSAAS